MNSICAIRSSEPYSEKCIRESFYILLKHYDYLKSIINPGDRVLVKPNLVAPSKMATTDIIMLECIIDVILSSGGIPVVAESSGFEFSTSATFNILGISELCKKKGVQLVNLDEEECVEVESGNEYVPKYLVSKRVFESDRIINMPRLKGHSVTKVTFSIKNLFGLLHRKTRRRIHASDLEYGIQKLKKIIPVDFIIVDALWNLSTAVYSDAKYEGIMLAGKDLNSVDAVCCKLYGIDYKTIPHIYNPMEKYDITYKELNKVGRIDSCIKEDRDYKKTQANYKLMYGIDDVFYSIFHVSAIPYVHYFAGIRPTIDRHRCNDCKRCHSVCPVQAIGYKRIDWRKCLNVRCMKCYDICPNHAVVKKGLHK